MSEIKTAEEIVNNLTVNDDGFIHIKPDTLKLLFEKHHLQFRPTDEEIQKIFPTQNVESTTAMAINLIKQAGAKWMRDQIYGTKEK